MEELEHEENAGSHDNKHEHENEDERQTHHHSHNHEQEFGDEHTAGREGRGRHEDKGKLPEDED